MFSKGDKWGQNDKKALSMGFSDCFYLSPYLFSPGTRGDKTSQKPVIKGVSGGDKICPLMRDKLLRGYTKNIKSNTRQEEIKYILSFSFSLFSYVLHPTIRRGTGKNRDAGTANIGTIPDGCFKNAFRRSVHTIIPVKNITMAYGVCESCQRMRYVPRNKRSTNTSKKAESCQNIVCVRMPFP